MAKALTPPQDGTRLGSGVVICTGIRCGKNRSAPDGMAPGAILRCDPEYGGCGQLYSRSLTDLYRSKSGGSCGCLKRELISQMRKASPVHGHARRGSQHPLYNIWKGMIARCEHPQATGYQNYGGRGIRVCDRWHSVEVFISDIERWLGPRPEGMTLDRIQGAHDYRLDNVQWASRAQQNGNRRKPSRSPIPA